MVVLGPSLPGTQRLACVWTVAAAVRAEQAEELCVGRSAAAGTPVGMEPGRETSGTNGMGPGWAYQPGPRARLSAGSPDALCRWSTESGTWGLREVRWTRRSLLTRQAHSRPAKDPGGPGSQAASRESSGEALHVREALGAVCSIQAPRVHLGEAWGGRTQH